MTVPYTFANQTGSIPLSELDANFSNVSNYSSSAGTVVSNAQPNITSVGTLVSLSATGNITGSYFLGNGSQLTGLSATYGNANVVANLAALGSNPVSTTGNITGGNIRTVGLITATGNVTGNYFIGNGSQLTGLSSSYGNANVVANLAALGTNPISTTGNISANYYVGNGSLLTGIGVSSYGNANVVANLAALGSNPISTTGNITGGNVLFGSGVVSGTGNVSGNVGTFTTHNGTTFSASGNVTGGNVLTGGQITSTGAGNTATNGGQIFLNGVTLNRIDWNTNGTGSPEYTTRSAGAKVVLYPSIGGSSTDYALGVEAGALWSGIPGNDNGQFFKWYGGNVSVANLSGTGVFSVAGTVTGANILTGGLISATSTITSAANVTGGNILTGGIVSATGNISGGNLSVGTGIVSIGSLVNNNSNGVGNIGSATTYFNTVYAQATTAQ